MTVYRQIAKVPAIFKGGEWQPDMGATPLGVGWVLLEFDQENSTMVIEFFASDHPDVDSKATAVDILATVAKDQKITPMLTHPKSPTKIFWTDKDGKVGESG